MAGSLSAWWQRRSTRAKVVVVALATLPFVVAAVSYMANSDGLEPIDPENAAFSYFMVFLLIALDAVCPIFPGETTLNAAATFAAQGKLDLVPIIVAGALGAIVGDSSLFWLARRFCPQDPRPRSTRAKANPKVRQAFDLMDSSAGVLIIGGRYVPGMRFVVNGTMGLSDIAYRRFLMWSVISGILWSTYTTVLAYEIGKALGDYPLASFVISGLVTTVAITIIFFTVRHQRRKAVSDVEQT